MHFSLNNDKESFRIGSAVVVWVNLRPTLRRSAVRISVKAIFSIFDDCLSLAVSEAVLTISRKIDDVFLSLRDIRGCLNHIASKREGGPKWKWKVDLNRGGSWYPTPLTG